MPNQSIFTKSNIFIFFLAALCLLEAAQMVNFSLPLFPDFPADPADTFHRALRKDLSCASATLAQNNVERAYFLNSEALAGRNLLFESFYTSYILAPKILVNTDIDNLYAIAVIDPKNTEQLLRENQYELVQRCGSTGVLVLKRKPSQP